MRRGLDGEVGREKGEASKRKEERGKCRFYS